eukprot:gene5010-5251_t
MKWTPCFTSLASPTLNLPRFGHTAVVINGEDKFSDLVVVYGGVGAQSSGDNAQIALGDVVVLQVDSGTWSAPDILADSSTSPSDKRTGHGSSGGGPGPRAFHSAVALPGQQVLVFGGHILTLDQDHSRKRRTFYNDVWLLDTALRDGEAAGAGSAAAGGGGGGGGVPSERMCHSLSRLPGGRLLLLGGRHKDGICQDQWWLSQQVVLLLADYQQLAPSFYERQVLSRLKDGFQAAAAAGTVDGEGCFFLHRQPHELLYCQVELLQSEYKHLLMSGANC